MVLDNPSPFYNPFQFEITFECIEDLSEGERVAPGCQLRRRTLKFPGSASRGVGRGRRPAGGRPCEGNLKLRDAGRVATCEQLAGRREPCCQLCLRRAALGGPGSRGAGGGRAASAAPGPRGPAGSTRGRRGAEPSYPAARRLLRTARGERARAFLPQPRRGCPRAALRLLPPTSAEGGRWARPSAPGSRRPPCSPRAPGMLCAASGAARTPLPGDGDLSERNSEGLGSSIPPESKSPCLTSSRHFISGFQKVWKTFSRTCEEDAIKITPRPSR